jgi:hypothetical protein
MTRKKEERQIMTSKKKICPEISGCYSVGLINCLHNECMAWYCRLSNRPCEKLNCNAKTGSDECVNAFCKVIERD